MILGAIFVIFRTSHLEIDIDSNSILIYKTLLKWQYSKETFYIDINNFNFNLTPPGIPVYYEGTDNLIYINLNIVNKISGVKFTIFKFSCLIAAQNFIKIINKRHPEIEFKILI